jgi:heme exporter protein D
VTEFFAMGGYGFYVWGSYGVTAIVVVAEVLAVRSRRRAVLEEARLSGPDDVPVRGVGVVR